MIAYVARRLAIGAALLVVISLVAFVLLRTAAGDTIARNILGDTATPDQILAKERELGLDRPVLLQYLDWLGGAVRGDLGR
jgi:peptide/nickel transport system permease protein